MTALEKLVLSTLSNLQPDREGFYGIISLHFQNGQLSVIRREQTIKPESIGEQRRYLSNDSNRAL